MLRRLIQWMNRLPAITFPWGGEKAYEDLWREHQYWSFQGPMAKATSWREVWHLIGSLTYTALGTLLGSLVLHPPTAAFLSTFLIAVAYFYKEMWADAKGRPDFKNFIDWAVWVFPSGVLTFFVFYLWDSTGRYQ